MWHQHDAMKQMGVEEVEWLLEEAEDAVTPI